jgi:hypothetical protein
METFYFFGFVAGNDGKFERVIFQQNRADVNVFQLGVTNGFGQSQFGKGFIRDAFCYFFPEFGKYRLEGHKFNFLMNCFQK